jgi:ABC-type multidrug transport system fused ATPase/permease subunit
MTIRAPEGGVVIRELMWKHRGPLLFGLGLMTANRMAALGLPVGFKMLIDQAIGRSQPRLVTFIALGISGTILVEAATMYGVSRVVGQAAQRASADLRRGLLVQALRLPMRFLDGTLSGSLASRMISDADQAQSLLGTGVVSLANGILTAVLALGVLAWLEPGLAIVAAVAAATFVVALMHLFRGLYPAFVAVNDRAALVAGSLSETVAMMPVIKTCAAERREALRFARESNELARAGMRAVVGTAWYGAVCTVTSGVIGLAVLIVGARAVQQGTMSVGDLVLYFGLAGLLWAPLIQMAATCSQLSRMVAAMARIDELRATPTEERIRPGRQRVSGLNGRVTLDAVSFSYGKARPAIRDVSLDVPAGARVALVGPSGAGKSTVASLIASLLAPTTGRVLVDGRDLESLCLRDYRRHLGVVLQGDGSLFSGSIEANIRFARPTATHAEIRSATRLAHCEEFLERLPEGLSTVLGERGAQLSGGQRQRVVLARAFLANPRILILDEATSQLDPGNEMAVGEALHALLEGRTAFILGHRIPVVPGLTHVFLLDGGRLMRTEGISPTKPVGPTP